MNISQLQPTSSAQVQKVSKNATDRDAEFLSFKLLNKRARVRLSPNALNLDALPGKGHLIAVANSKGWFAAMARAPEGEYLIFSPLSELQASFASQAEDDEIAFQPHRKLPVLGGTVTLITFAHGDTRLVAALSNGAVAIFDSAVLFSRGNDTLSPLHVFQASTPSPVRQLTPNPGDSPELLAVLHESNGTPGHTLVQVFDLQKLEAVVGWSCGAVSDTIPTTLSWSPKGKQLAIGLQNGDIASFALSSPSTPKSVTPGPPSATNLSVISATWLSNPTFHAIYAPQGSIGPDADQGHFIISLDSKAKTMTDIKLNTPYMNLPGLRSPGSFIIILRKWDPADAIMVIGDSTSSDIGVIGSVSDASDPANPTWHNFSLEETGTPSLPLDKEMNDTVLLGLEMDLTASQRYQHTAASGEDLDLPPPPIMYAYCSDGTLQAWHVVNTSGKAYPGMTELLAGQSMGPAASAPRPLVQPTMSALGAISRVASDAAMSESPVTPHAGASVSGQTSNSGFGQPSAAPLPMSQTPTFGTQNASAFGQPSFGQTSALSGTGGSASSGGAFSAFSASGPSAFAQSSFGFGAKPTPQPAPDASSDAMNSDASAPLEDLMTDGTSGTFGGLSLGSNDSDSKKPSPFGDASGVFGPPVASPMTSGGDATEPTTAFGSGSFGSGSAFKPAQGFGAFSNPGQSSVFSKPVQDAKLSSAFGQSAFAATAAFGQSTTRPAGAGAFSNLGQSQPPPAATGASPSMGPAFGTTSFGSAPAFGQSAFGSSTAAFGQTSFGTGASTFGQPAAGNAQSSSSLGSSGGFSSFAGSGKSTFSQTNKAETSPVQTTGAFSAFSGSGASAFAPTTPNRENDGSKVTETASPSTPQSPAPPTNASSTSSTPEAVKTPIRRADLSPADESPPSTPISRPFSAFQATPAFTSSTGATTGAFGSLQSTPNAFSKPGEGFGAFGAFGASSGKSNSPFLSAAAKAGTGSPTVSIFGQGTSTTPTKPPPVSAFGAPSTTLDGKPVFGQSAFGQSAFAKISTTPASSPLAATAVKAPSSGGFGAFSGGSAGFVDASGAKKSSFGDLLRTGDESKNGKSAAIPPATTALPASTVKGANTASSEGEGEATTSPENSEGDRSNASAPKPVPKEESISSLSSSFTEVERPSDEETEGPENDGSARSDEDGTDTEPEAEDDTGSFVSEGFSDEYPEEEEEEDGQNEEELEEQDIPSTSPPESPVHTPVKSEAASQPITPVAESLPRSASATPQPDAPGVRVQPSTPSKSDSEASTGLPKRSTTPPGSPPLEKPVTSATSSPVVSPTPVSFGLAPGKPSTRPTRSSPLANVANADQDAQGRKGQETKLTPSPTNQKPRPASPKPAFGSYFPSTPPVVKQEEGSTSRPKTPPLLSSFGIGAPRVAPRGITPPIPPTSSPSSFGPPPGAGASSTIPPPSSIFGKPFTIPSAASTLTPSAFGTFPALSKGPLTSPSPTGTPPMPQAATFTTGTSVFPSMFGKGPGTPSISGIPQTSTGSVFPSGFAQGPGTPGAPTPPISASSTASTLPSGFGKGLGTPPTGSPFGGGGIYAKTSPSATPPFASAAQLGPRQTPPAAFSGFGNATPSTQPIPTTMPVPKPAFTANVPIATPAPSPPRIEEGMQAECIYLFASLTKELEDLRILAQTALQRKDEISRPIMGPRGKADLGDRSKWSLGDVMAHGETMQLLQQDVRELKEQRDTLTRSVRRLESDMLKAGTRKEEIARFNKARTDDGFAKMLKARTLGPEHLETQTQLRRDIRNMRDRIQKLEAHLSSSKKRLASAKSGKSQLKAPSLDTINRTLRNIDLALDQESTDVDSLASRIAKLDHNQTRSRVASSRDPRLLGSPSRQARQVTPSVAASTASALNAERSAQKLKRALLAVRTKPLLNTSAATAPPPLKQFETPGKPKIEAKGDFSLSDMAPAEDLPEWALPPPSTAFSTTSFAPVTPTHGPAARRSNTRHLKPVQLKKSPSPVVSTAAPSFDWGPLPVASAPPRTTLAFDVRAGANQSPSAGREQPNGGGFSFN